MGFPAWTLWGMGLSATAALLAMLLAYIAQSPQLLRRFRLLGTRVPERARAYTGLGVAALLLSLGFFLAGVPLDNGSVPVAETSTAAPAFATPNPLAQVVTQPAEAGSAAADTAVVTPRPTSATPVSGSFGQLSPPGSTGEGLDPAIEATAEAIASEVSQSIQNATTTPESLTTAQNAAAIPAATATLTPTPSATPTNSPTPTPTSTPTLTPTPITGPIATINSTSSTVWVRRSPGGQQLVLVRTGDVVLLEGGHASQDTALWRQVRTADEGVLGWVPERNLDLPEDG